MTSPIHSIHPLFFTISGTTSGRGVLTWLESHDVTGVEPHHLQLSRSVSALQKASLLHHAVAWQPLEVQKIGGAFARFFFFSVIKLCAMPMCHWREALKWNEWKLCDMMFSLKAAFVGDIGLREIFMMIILRCYMLHMWIDLIYIYIHSIYHISVFVGNSPDQLAD